MFDSLFLQVLAVPLVFGEDQGAFPADAEDSWDSSSEQLAAERSRWKNLFATFDWWRHYVEENMEARKLATEAANHRVYGSSRSRTFEGDQEFSETNGIGSSSLAKLCQRVQHGCPFAASELRVRVQQWQSIVDLADKAQTMTIAAVSTLAETEEVPAFEQLFSAWRPASSLDAWLREEFGRLEGLALLVRSIAEKRQLEAQGSATLVFYGARTKEWGRVVASVARQQSRLLKSFMPRSSSRRHRRQP